MFRTDAFNYIDILDKALDASWKRETIISNNLANVDTPGYKRQDLDFASVLKQELGRSKYTTLDAKVADVHKNHLTPSVYTDYGNYSYRIDRNNVDVDTENVELASERIRYLALQDATSFEFSALKTAISAS